MSQDFDKEVEVLLRRHARRNAAGLAADSSAVAKQGVAHMDADELSAYAEGALPEASRSRYMLHLADCDSCRKIVTELLLSSGVEAEAGTAVAQTVESPSRSWREWLATLFSPPVLRYAAPVVALVAFASIIFVVITRNRDLPSVAQRRAETEQAANADANEQTAAPSNAGTSNSATANEAATSSAGANNAGPGVAPAPEAARDTGTTTATTQSDGVSTDAAPKPAELGANAPPPTVQESATETKQTQPPAQAAAPVDKSADAGNAKDNSGFMKQDRRESNVSPMGGASSAGTSAGSGRRAQSTEVAKSNPSPGTTTDGVSGEERQKKETPSRSGLSAPAARARRDTAGADEESAATRTVAGKRFRQQNGVWVDTSYSSSRSLTRVRRGSEQYRALVADEPIIGTVSNSLSGAVIVVAGGRAYHIY